MEVHGYVENIADKIRNKRALDIGCLGSFRKTLLMRHNVWAKAAKEIIGIDNNKEFLDLPVVKKRENIFYCDITNEEEVTRFLDRHGKFPHIIATDVIEHLGNMTSFLNNVKMFMALQSTLYLTTNNVRSLVWQAMWDGRMAFLENDDHICWFDLDTLKVLLRRSGLKVHKHFYCFNKQDRQLADDHKIEWRPSLGRRIYLQIRKIDR